MRLIVPNGSLRPILRWTQFILFACAISSVAYIGFALTDAWTFQNHERDELDRLLGSRDDGSRLTKLKADVTPTGLTGRIEIARIGISVMVVEGTSRATLRRAVGHIAGTGLPGQPGNVGISGHRDTFFRPLRNIRQNDMVTLTTLAGQYRYRVVSTRIVVPTNVAVLASDENEILTLVTCYPFYFVGSAPERFIVRAERVRDAS